MLVAVTAIGNDRPGIVAGITKVLFELGCNLEDATSTILRGHFAMMLVVRTASGIDARRVEEALAPAAEDLRVVVTARPVEEAALEIEPATHVLSVYGSDRPGIVAAVAARLAEAGASITDLSSRVIGSSNDPVYTLLLEVALPPGTDIEATLSALRSELDVDVTIRPLESDVL